MFRGKNVTALLKYFNKAMGTVEKQKIHSQPNQFAPKYSRMFVQERHEPSRLQSLNFVLREQQHQGLPNIGNTCFMNSALQCMFHLQLFNEEICGMSIPSKASVSAQYISLYKSTLGGRPSPSALKGAVSRKTRQFSGYAQQDSYEFLSVLLDCLHKELNRISQKSYKELTYDSSKSISENSQDWWKYYRSIDDSIVYDYFAGQIFSSIECGDCGHVSGSFEEFLSLHLSFGSHYHSVDLKELLKMQFQNEKVEFKCEKHKKVTSCLRKFYFWKLPKVLIIHLKRFQMSSLYRRKMDVKVNIPETLSLQEFLSEENKGAAADYQLSGVIKHSGFINGGHYTADCRAKGRWYEYNDSHVGRTNPTLTGSSPYVLLYVLK